MFVAFSEYVNFDKGGLISEGFSLWLHYLKKGAKSLRKSAQESDLAPLFEECIQNYRISEIKLPFCNLDSLLFIFLIHYC